MQMAGFSASTGIKMLPKLFDAVWTPVAVREKLCAGRSKEYDAPNPDDYAWLPVVNPSTFLSPKSEESFPTLAQ